MLFSASEDRDNIDAIYLNFGRAKRKVDLEVNSLDCVWTTSNMGQRGSDKPSVTSV